MLKVANSVISASRITGVLPVVNGGTGVTTSTGTGNTVLSAAPTLSGDVTLSTGNLVIGTDGKGIDFSITSSGSGTMTSELLADYEEGTWTPSQGAGLTVVGTFSSSGTYTKVGRMVTLRGYVSGSTSVALSTTGTVLCGNIPFTPTTQTTDRYVGEMVNQTFTNFGAVSALGSFTTIYNIGSLAADTYIHFTVVYFV
jgi:hypothetical protein